MKRTLLWIEPPVATVVDIRTGRLANRKRCPYPRVGPTLCAMLQKGALSKALESCGSRQLLPSGWREVHWSTEIIDCVAMAFEQEESFSLDYTNYQGPVDYYSGLRYGLGSSGLVKELEKRVAPDVVALPSSFTSQKEEVLRMASVIKSLWRNVKIVTGGHFASYAFHDLLSSNLFSAVCIGESWISFPIVLHHLVNDRGLSEVRGVAYVDSEGDIVDNRSVLGSYSRLANIDKIPPPSWELIPFHTYDQVGLDHMERFRSDDRVAPLDSEFGCGLKPPCRFCSAGTYNNGFVASKSPERVFYEIRSLVERFGRNFFYLDNDNPFIHQASLLELFELLREYNRRRIATGERQVRFALTNGASSWSLQDSELVSSALSAGMAHAAIGLESASPGMLKLVGKPLQTPRFVVGALENLRAEESKIPGCGSSMSQIPVEVFVQVGLPYETKDDLDITASFCGDLVGQFGVTITPLYFCPIHGAPLREDFLAENPKAEGLPDLIMGLMGTSKKDSRVSNLLADEYYDRFRNMNSSCRTVSVQRF